MIIGIPNVGTSTLINHIRKGSLRVKNNALRTGNKPGITRTLENKVKVSEEPLVYLLDTPGIMMPNIKDMHVGMKLAACGTLKDEAIGEQNIVDYLLFALNRAGNLSYLDYMKIVNNQRCFVLQLLRLLMFHMPLISYLHACPLYLASLFRVYPIDRQEVLLTLSLYF